MNYKLLAIDVDGTLVGSDFLISQQNKTAIRAAISQGVNVILCSGRSYASLRHFAAELSLNSTNNYAISFNGCAIHNSSSHELIHNSKMPTTTATYILNQLNKFNIESVIYWDIFGIYANTNRKFADFYLNTCGATPTFISDYNQITQEFIYKIIAIDDNEILKKIENYFLKIPDKPFNMFFSGHHMFEFCSQSASKGSALNNVCTLLGINIENAIAIGDSDNDISMISSAGLGVAMQNANRNVKSVANYITTNNCQNHGVAEVIEKFILK